MEAHEVLGVAPGAGPDEVRLAFRRFVRLHHPDRGGDPERFRQGVAAYRRLTGDQTDTFVRAPANVVFHRRPRGVQIPLEWLRHQRRRRRPRVQ